MKSHQSQTGVTCPSLSVSASTVWRCQRTIWSNVFLPPQTAFSQISLAFRCDQYTLKQRLQAEEHARNLAEENIQLELTRGRETLEALKSVCLDSKRSNILQRLELCLDILGGTVERISTTAEVLGAVHQEARVSRAVELMVAHVESLRRRHDRNVAELEETKKMMQQQNPRRRSINPTISADVEESDKMGSNQNVLRRRISASVISSQTQEKKKRDSRKRVSSIKKPSPVCLSRSLSLESSCLTITRDDSYSMDDRPHNPERPEASAPQPPPDPTLGPAPNPEIPTSEQAPPIKTQTKNPTLDTLRQRHKGKAALSNKGKEKKVTNIYSQNSMGTCGTPCKQHPLGLRLYHCRWTRICINLLLLICVIMLTYFFWKLHEGEFEP
ncbi:inositol 1,4,5-triphosphate receptor associated 2 isoform X2 [Melanotaenia boesemani]|uniref:inositol 1,4,5-triphosphate receptor associated 2 isoform X2 n=1 Tax=Melanotaenia boesemani TaxID=1250792 RepID=UPI001C03F4DF|nr:inositol 1,4,5-triphosphate receptor associated 2 isoform X2 [Melanotaenia boesemani]